MNAYPKIIGRRHLGDKLSDGERDCDHGHDVPAGHPLYWHQAINQYDDGDPVCLEHAIEQYASEQGWHDAALSNLATPSATTGELQVDFRAAMVDAARARGGAGAEFIAKGESNLWLDIAFDAFAALSPGDQGERDWQEPLKDAFTAGWDGARAGDLFTGRWQAFIDSLSPPTAAQEGRDDG